MGTKKNRLIETVIPLKCHLKGERAQHTHKVNQYIYDQLTSEKEAEFVRVK